ncbi:MAG: peptide deformylase [Chloroflexi bacterium]|nr:peptide deformylase [Chloroflexota bacterium]
MAIIPIRIAPDPVLRQKSKRVRFIDSSINKLINDMLETMRFASGAGLAAPQIGIPLRVIVIGLPEQKDICLINPQIVRKRGERLVTEGCLSIPGYRGEVKRSVSVTAKGQDRSGKEIRIKAEELLAQVLEHEIDHLNGVLYVDKLESMDKLHKLEPEEAQL